MTFADMCKIGFDTETTGPDPLTDRIVTAAIIARGGPTPTLPQVAFTWLINPGMPIGDEAAAVHGVTNEIAKTEGQDPKVALEDIASRLAAAIRYGLPVIAFNLSFDWTILDRDLRRHDLAPMGERLGDTLPALIDPHVIDRRFDRYRKGSGMRKLKPTCEVYGVELEDWHTAEADALAALLIAEAQFERFPLLQRMGPAELFVAQQEWRREQQAGLQEWFRDPVRAGDRHDPEIVIDGSWPLRPFEAGEGQ